MLRSGLLGLLMRIYNLKLSIGFTSQLARKALSCLTYPKQLPPRPDAAHPLSLLSAGLIGLFGFYCSSGAYFDPVLQGSVSLGPPGRRARVKQW